MNAALQVNPSCLPVAQSRTSVVDCEAFLDSKAGQLSVLYATETANLTLIRYRIGEVVSETIAMGRACGTNLVSRLAAAVGRDVDTLYDCASVAARWDINTFQELAQRTNDVGVALSFSHFVALARKNGKFGVGLPIGKCEELYDRAITEKLSVRALARAVREALRVPSPSGARAEPPFNVLRKRTTAFDRKAHAVAAVVDALARAAVAEEDRVALDAVIETIERTSALCLGVIAQLKDVAHRAGTARPVAPAFAAASIPREQ